MLNVTQYQLRIGASALIVLLLTFYSLRLEHCESHHINETEEDHQNHDENCLLCDFQLAPFGVIKAIELPDCARAETVTLKAELFPFLRETQLDFPSLRGPPEFSILS